MTILFKLIPWFTGSKQSDHTFVQWASDCHS